MANGTDPDTVALVTGASGVIGQAICLRLAAAVGHVVVHCHSRTDQAEALVKTIMKTGGSAEWCAADLRSETGPDRVVERALGSRHRLDFLINNAGIVSDSMLGSMTDGAIASVLDVNLMSAMRVTRAACRPMVAARRGVIINMSSAAASVPGAGQANYAASKAALEGFTRAMAVELAPKGIRVNAVAPGFIDSDMTRAVRARHEDRLLRRILLRRFGCPDDVAAAVCYLVSPDADYVTGHVLRVDGGMLSNSAV